MQFTYYGHSTFGVKSNNVSLLFDPFITPNPMASAVNVDSIEANFILLSHGHLDHVADVVQIAKRTGATVVCAYEIMEWLNKQGVDKVHPMNTGGEKQFEGFKVKCVVAQHSNSMPDGSPAGQPMGFVITIEDRSFYYAGDTALTMDMQLIPRWGKIEFAVLPIGDNFTMGAADAATAAYWVKTERVVGVHYNTFGYIVVDEIACRKEFSDRQIELLLPAIGETISI